MNRLQTVTGTAPVEDIGTADAHAHVWIDPPEDVPDDARIELTDADAIRHELDDYRAAGGTLIVDCQPGRCGRNANRLIQFATSSEAHITATTGFHLQKYYPPNDWLWSADETEAATYFIEELTERLFEADGARATTVKVGYAGEIAGQTRVLMEAAAEAARVTGAVVLVHTEAGKNVEALLPFYDARGVPSTQLYLCHVDKRPDAALHRELARAGVLLGYDTFARQAYEPERNVWRLLPQMVESGYSDQIAIGLDLARPSQWRYAGGAGMQMLIDVIIPRLRAGGMDEATIRALTGQNIARFLVRRDARDSHV